MRDFRRSCLLALLCGLVSLWGQSGARPNLTGTWKLAPAKSDVHEKLSNVVWVIDQKDSTIHLSESATTVDGKDWKVEFDCPTNGKECSVNEPGQAAKLSLWYNGPALIEMEFRGHNRENVLKKKITVGADGKVLQIEVTRIVPPGERPEKLVFEKQS